jgi:hypothetical protein
LGEDSAGELSQLVIIMRKQAELQTSRRNEIVPIACVGCGKSVQVPNELLEGKFLETSVEFFCPFCDASCSKPRCVVCRISHYNEHVQAIGGQVNATG